MLSEHRLRRGLVSRPETLGLRPHRIRNGQQAITLTIPRKPVGAGIDPHLLLIDLGRVDNVESVEIER